MFSETYTLRESESLPTVSPIDKLLDEGNCGEVTIRGKEGERMCRTPAMRYAMTNK